MKRTSKFLRGIARLALIGAKLIDVFTEDAEDKEEFKQAVPREATPVAASADQIHAKQQQIHDEKVKNESVDGGPTSPSGPPGWAEYAAAQKALRQRDEHFEVFINGTTVRGDRRPTEIRVVTTERREVFVDYGY